MTLAILERYVVEIAEKMEIRLCVYSVPKLKKMKSKTVMTTAMTTKQTESLAIASILQKGEGEGECDMTGGVDGKTELLILSVSFTRHFILYSFSFLSSSPIKTQQMFDVIPFQALSKEEEEKKICNTLITSKWSFYEMKEVRFAVGRRAPPMSQVKLS